MKFRFSGHESFVCRYTWLPKAYNAILATPTIFADDNNAMVKLGVGKNMVKSIKFWVQAFGVATVKVDEPGLVATGFGNQIFGVRGFDPFLEDAQTLWLLHWKISSISENPLFAWYFLLNQWSDPNFSKSEIIDAFTRESELMERPLSSFTKEQHFDIFLHTYLPGRPRTASNVLEDSLDSPLNELQLITPAGERVLGETGKREPVYEFRNGINRDISQTLFVYCIFDYWQKHRHQEWTISFRDLSMATGSLGNIFRLTESDLRARLDTLQADTDGMFEYFASAAVPRIVRNIDLNERTEQQLLAAIYQN